mmetsp:Transcript_5186/g.7287  ORF Transcript_5186/g.7287 Transcript_5186/m.7287 type:complete len:89 (-) Transcript_5186:937-1203(-)
MKLENLLEFMESAAEYCLETSMSPQLGTSNARHVGETNLVLVLAFNVLRFAIKDMSLYCRDPSQGSSVIVETRKIKFANLRTTQKFRS